MIRYVLDTNICIEIIRGRGGNILTRLERCEVGEVAISAITFAELEHGVEKSSRPEQNRVALRQFCAPIEILAFDDLAAAVYGRLRAAMEKEGNAIGPMDLLIAAHALSADCTLVTNNEREFRRIKGLRIENWL